MRTLGSWEAELDGGGGPSWFVDFKDIDEELRYLRKVVASYRGNPKIRNLAISILKDCRAPERDKKTQALCLAAWVQDNIYYVHELPERFQLPDETLRLRAGDCDDTTVLVCALCESVGIPSMLCCMRINGVYSHIFPAAVMTGAGSGGSIAEGSSAARLLPLDTTMKQPVMSAPDPIRWAQERGKDVRVKLA